MRLKTGFPLSHRPLLRGAAATAATMLAASAVAAGASAGGVPRTLDSPAAAQCGAQRGQFAWNSIWRVDTSGFPGTVGFTCMFPLRPEAALIADPRLRGAESQCDAYGGSFYHFSAQFGPDPATDTLYSGYGCEWLF